MKDDEEQLSTPSIERHEGCGHSLLHCPRCGSDGGLHVVDISCITRDRPDAPNGSAQGVFVGDHGLLAHRIDQPEHLADMPSGNFTEIGFRCLSCDPQDEAPVMYLRIRSENGTELSWHPEDVDEPEEDASDEEPPPPELTN